jgi:hypothetical protein
MNLFNVNYSYVHAVVVVVVVVPELAAFVICITKYRKISVMFEKSLEDVEKIHTDFNRHCLTLDRGNEYTHSLSRNAKYNYNDVNIVCVCTSFALKKKNK